MGLWASVSQRFVLGRNQIIFKWYMDLQLLWDVEPVASVEDPVGHSWHIVWATWSWYVPSEQNTQALSSAS